MIITKTEAEKLLSKDGKHTLSLDLGKSFSDCVVEGDIVSMGGQRIPKEQFRKVKEGFCYFIEDNTLKKISLYSEETRLYYKLFPTKDWPTFMVSATPMHMHTHVTPKQQTKIIMAEISPIRGNVLDTCCGLGYTAIMSSHHANEVHTFELDSNVITLCRLNPHSHALFGKKNIILHQEAVYEGIAKLPALSFDRVIHDPPTFKRAPELFSMAFYGELWRVMKPGAVMYHYAPLPHKTKGAQFNQVIMKNLRAQGFANIVYHPRSSGVVARKPR